MNIAPIPANIHAHHVIAFLSSAPARKNYKFVFIINYKFLFVNNLRTNLYIIFEKKENKFVCG